MGKITCAICGRELSSVNKPHDKRDHEIIDLESIVEFYKDITALQALKIRLLKTPRDLK